MSYFPPPKAKGNSSDLIARLLSDRPAVPGAAS
jgi:hypothetical protein